MHGNDQNELNLAFDVLNDFVSMETRKTQVQQENVGPSGGDNLNRLPSVRCLANNFKGGVILKQFAKSGAH